MTEKAGAGRIVETARKKFEHREPLEVNVGQDAIKRLIAHAENAKGSYQMIDSGTFSSLDIKEFVGTDRAKAFDIHIWFDHLAKDLKDGRTVKIIPLKDRKQGDPPDLRLNSSSSWTCIFTWERLVDLLQEIFSNNGKDNELMEEPLGVRVALQDALQHDRAVVLISPTIQRQE